MAGRAGAILGVLFLAHVAAAQFVQQGGKLVGSGAVGPAHQGYSVAVSADGNTAIVGGYGDTAFAGAAWVFTRSAGVWSQQESKLVGMGAVGVARFGKAVAIAGNGNTAIVGAPYDNFNAGAAWLYTCSGGVWSQLGSKLVGTGAVGDAEQGWSAAISADGATAIVGGPFDDSNTGAAWVFTLVGGVWSQQGDKLVGTGAAGGAAQGYSVAISADGNTAILGGVADNSFAGAAWVFTRSGGVWSQQGSKLVGADAIGGAFQGYSVAVSANGDTVILGGYGDNSAAGAAWVFTRSAGAWSQQGGKLAGTGAVGAANQGAVAVSADGTTVIAGGSYDDSKAGAAWVFVTPGCTPPAITAQPQGQTIQSGQTATLSMTATGTTALTYQWYQGDAGDISAPVGGDASTFTTPPLLATTSFWVRVSNACGTADSATAMVTVGPARAEAPAQGNVGDGVPGPTPHCEAPGAPVAPSGGMWSSGTPCTSAQAERQRCAGPGWLHRVGPAELTEVGG